jgi:hypothetical protein
MEGNMTWLDKQRPKAWGNTLTEGKNEEVNNAGVIAFAGRDERI